MDKRKPKKLTPATRKRVTTYVENAVDDLKWLRTISGLPARVTLFDLVRRVAEAKENTGLSIACRAFLQLHGDGY